MNIEQLKDEIKDARSRIRNDQAFVRETEQAIAEHLCPFSVGDKIVSPTGEKIIVASIRTRGWKPWYDFKAFKIKKNGDPYKESQHVYGDITAYVLAT